MYQSFSIKKQTGTYSETLEAFGVANLISNIFLNKNIQAIQIKIEDKGTNYLVTSNKPITDEILNNISYFLVIKFIKKELTQIIPEDISVNGYFDYPKNKAIQDDFKERYKQIEKLKTEEAKRQAKKVLNEEKLLEFGNKIDIEFDVYREIIKNPYASFEKLFYNFYKNQEHFQVLIKEILNYYTEQKTSKKSFKLVDEKPTSQQLYNPNQGKGLNRGKANNATMSNLNSNWISETMKTSGALSFMVCQYIKVGSSYDLKIYVPEFNNILLNEAKKVVFNFKKHLKSTSPVRLDIINILDFTEKFIKETPEYNKGKVKNTIKGFHSVYQKDLGQNKAVANIAFIQTPDFVEYQTKEQGIEWIEILNQQKAIISNIEELGDSLQGLQSYRNFLGSIGNTALANFFKFSYWYAGYLIQKLAGNNRFIRIFKIEHLNKFYINMEPNLNEIIENEGFQSVATAIRNSTIRLQIKSNFQNTHQRFEIKYGFVQELQSKARAKNELAKFIGNFLGKYNAETARYKEKSPNVVYRPNVRKEDEDKFYFLLEKYSNCSGLIGSLLASYGFALEKYEESDIDKLEKLQKEAEKLGYELVKVETPHNDEIITDNSIEAINQENN